MNCKAFLYRNPGSTAGSVGLLALRLVAGLALVQHGWGKIQNPLHWMGPDATIPPFFQALAAISEFGGGIAWILGVLTPLFSFGMLCTMTVAVHRHAIEKGDPFVASAKGQSSYELALVYLVIALLLLLAGPGRCSLDALIWGRQKD